VFRLVKTITKYSIMIKRSLLTISLIFAISSPAAAWTIKDEIEDTGQYWQRVHTASSVYVRGPKAQQMLNRDIARCVVELRELERLGEVKNAIPVYAKGLVLSEIEAELEGWDAPERDAELFAEHTDYEDFEGCMLAKGWSRVKHVPYEVAEQSKKTYLKSHSLYKKKYGDSNKPNRVNDYDHLNN